MPVESNGSTRIGLVGYGFGGRYFHAPLIASAPGVEFAGIVTRSEERRTLIAREHPGVPVFDDLAGLASSGARAVAISTPVETHVPLALEAIELGLSVVTDKPVAVDAASARPALLAAEAAGVLFTVYQNRRWDADLLTVRKLVQEGTLGRIRRLESRFERFQPESGPPAAGGGLLLDFGSHLFDQALYLFGPAASVYCEMPVGEVDADGRPVLEDRFFAVVRHRAGVSSHIAGNWVEGAPGPRFRLTGTEGSYVVEKTMEGQEPMIIAGRTPASEGDGWGVEPEADWGYVQRGAERVAVPTERGRWDAFYPAFAAAVRGEGALPVDPADSLAALELIDAARSSARTGQVVAL
jgi:predicted dehydrogenase